MWQQHKLKYGKQSQSNSSKKLIIRVIISKTLTRLQSYDMGIKTKVSEINRLIIYYILIINTCCDINLITCDIHTMRQKQVSELVTSSDANSINPNRIDFRINATELEQHIMSGLNLTKKPDVDMVSK